MKKPLAVSIACGIAIALMAASHKQPGFEKISTSTLKVQSTGLAALVYDTTRAAEFVGHYYYGAGSVNSLYQAFLAIHFEELDSALTFHSRVGRTNNSRVFPGDSNRFSSPTFAILENSSTVESYQLTYHLRNIMSAFRIRQIVTTGKDSTNIIYVSFIFEFPAPSGPDTLSFTNFRILFGYDGDIGSTTGGYSDDTSGFYEDSDLALTYVADTSSANPLFAGVALLNHRAEAHAGNVALLHQTINDSDRTLRDLDTMLFGFMTNPSFSPEPAFSDMSVYWTIHLGTIVPADTVRDTLRLALVNATSLPNLLLAARGQRLPPENGTPPPVDLPKVRLYQNAPNPFNPTTTIRYEVAEAGRIRIDIYNVLGQRVRRLVDSRHEKNLYEVQWNGTDERGKPVASGVYFYRLVTPEVTLTRRMLLVK